jgi:hypothetical protein
VSFPPEAKTFWIPFVFWPGTAKNAKKARKSGGFRTFRLYNTATRLYHETRKAAFRGN